MEIINSIKDRLLACGVVECHTSKAIVPLDLPAGVVSLVSLAGDKKTSTGYVDYTFKAECFIAVENNDNADEVLMVMLSHFVGDAPVRPVSNIDEVEFYDSMLGPRDVRIAKFEVEWQGGM